MTIGPSLRHPAYAQRAADYLHQKAAAQVFADLRGDEQTQGNAQVLDAELMKENLVAHLGVFQNLLPGQHLDVQVDIPLP